MASVASPTSQAPSSRRRGGTKEATTEDQALNMIAREAEARLAAKRAARAEARSIRMKEIERKQKEADDDEGTSEDNEPPDDSMYLKRSGRLSSPSLPAYDIPDTVIPSIQVTSDAQVIQLKDAVKEGEVKYKKAMVNAAQLDNERQALQYQVEVLKDIIEELQEKIENTDDELTHKCRAYNKLSREHNNTTGELKKCLFLLEDRERTLDENGINIDGTIREGYATQTPSQCSLCSASINDDLDSPVVDHRERGSLLAEIASLKNEIEDLKQTSNSEHARRELDSLKTERVELEQSFADVTSEAAVIRQDALHTGLYVNNNEKNDDFEMIDDGGQQGGIRHFEDQSFEKSTSSITSSMMTDAVTSMESSVPLELSVNNIRNKPTPKDDYDIVHVGDTGKTTANINVDSYTSLEYLPSLPSSNGDTSSDININKYLFSDPDDELHDDCEHYNTFSVDRYFAAAESAQSHNINPLDHIHIEDHNDFHTSVDTITNVQSDYDTIDTEEVFTNPESQFFTEENRDSPYEDVQVESVIGKPSGGMVIINQSESNEKNSFDATSVESSDIRLKPVGTSSEDIAVFRTDIDVAPSTVLPSEDREQIIMIDAVALPPPDRCHDETATKNNVPGVVCPVDTKQPEQPVTLRRVEFVNVEKATSVQVDVDAGEHDSINTSVESSMNTAFCGDDEQEIVPLRKVESITETEKIAIRTNVEELYNQIAGETNDVVLTTDEEHHLLRPAGGKGWLVQVESFTTPEVNAPEIKIVDVAPQGGHPEPKERKKKKKKKKNEKSDEGGGTHAQQEPIQNTVVPSDPLLLGFACEPSEGTQPPDNEKTTTRSKNDIPKQFLDASADLIDNSYSDASDIEDGEIGEDGKKKSTKRSKKEGCKSQ